jgi:hypothetical protein
MRASVSGPIQDFGFEDHLKRLSHPAQSSSRTREYSTLAILSKMSVGRASYVECAHRTGVAPAWRALLAKEFAHVDLVASACRALQARGPGTGPQACLFAGPGLSS